jgi:hypothetical protein
VSITGTYAFEVLDARQVISSRKEEHRVQVTEGQRIWLRANEYFLNDAYRITASTRSITAPELTKVYFKGPEDCHVNRTGSMIVLSKEEPVAAGRRDFTVGCLPGIKAPPRQSVDVQGRSMTVWFK